MTDQEHYRRNFKLEAPPLDNAPFAAIFCFVSAVVLFLVLQAAAHLLRGEL